MMYNKTENIRANTGDKVLFHEALVLVKCMHANFFLSSFFVYLFFYCGLWSIKLQNPLRWFNPCISKMEKLGPGSGFPAPHGQARWVVAVPLAAGRAGLAALSP